MVNDPTVSVIIPNRDRVALVLRALFSVARQTERSVECLVVDDGSRGDMAPVRALVEAMGGRFLRNVGPPGANGARAFGIGEARGSHVALLDSDDWMAPERLAVQGALARRIEAEGARPVLGCGMAFLKGEALYHFAPPTYAPGMAIPDYLYARGGLFQTSSLYLPRALALEVPFDTGLRVHQETDLMLRLWEAGAHIAVLPETLVVMDAALRRERISLDTDLLEIAARWYDARKNGWSPSARKGFLRRDMAPRLASAGRRGAALWCHLRGWDPGVPLGRFALDGLRLTMGGRVLGDGVTRLFGRSNRMDPDSPMVRLARADDRRAQAVLAGGLGVIEALREVRMQNL